MLYFSLKDLEFITKTIKLKIMIINELEIQIYLSNSFNTLKLFLFTFY